MSPQAYSFVYYPGREFMGQAQVKALHFASLQLLQTFLLDELSNLGMDQCMTVDVT